MIELKDYEGKQLASARELHKALELKKDFSNWFRYAKVVSGIEEDTYIEKLAKSTGGRPMIDYLLTKDAAIYLIMVSKAKNAIAVRREVLKAFTEKQTGILLNGDQIAKLTDIVKAMTLISNQKEVASKHFDFFGNKYKWNEYRTELLGVSKPQLEKAMNDINLKYVNQQKSLMRLKPQEMIRIGVIDLFVALGKGTEYALNVAEIAAKIAVSNGYHQNIIDNTKSDPLGLYSEKIKQTPKLTTEILTIQ